MSIGIGDYDIRESRWCGRFIYNTPSPNPSQYQEILFQRPDGTFFLWARDTAVFQDTIRYRMGWGGDKNGPTLVGYANSRPTDRMVGTGMEDGVRVHTYRAYVPEELFDARAWSREHCTPEVFTELFGADTDSI